MLKQSCSRREPVGSPVRAELRVDVSPDDPAPDAQMLVAETMILASAAVAEWARERGLPMLHRTQDVALPKEYAGVWTAPQDMARIMRALTPSSLELQARPHAALGLPRYTPVTSPLRRYPDLVNEAQVVHFLRAAGTLDESGLAELLNSLFARAGSRRQVQRFPGPVTGSCFSSARRGTRPGGPV